MENNHSCYNSTPAAKEWLTGPDMWDLGWVVIDKYYSTTTLVEKIFRLYDIPTTGLADLQASANNMLQSS